MQETAQNHHHMHKYNGGQAKRKGRSIKRQCVTCLAWDKWRTYRAPRPDLTPRNPRNVCHGFDTPKKPTLLDKAIELNQMQIKTDDKPMTKAEMVEHVNILVNSARDPHTGYPLDDRPQPGDFGISDATMARDYAETADTTLKDAAMSQRGAELLAMTVPELYKLAKDYGLKVTTKTKKAELISLIDYHEIGSADD